MTTIRLVADAGVVSFSNTERPPFGRPRSAITVMMIIIIIIIIISSELDLPPGLSISFFRLSEDSLGFWRSATTTEPMTGRAFLFRRTIHAQFFVHGSRLIFNELLGRRNATARKDTRWKRVTLWEISDLQRLAVKLGRTSATVMRGPREPDLCVV